MTTVDTVAGDWIAEHVLTPTYIRSCGSLALIRSCACQGGASAYCAKGDCGRCAHRLQPEWYAAPKRRWETQVVDTRGGARAAVYVEGSRCRWHCTCSCHNAPAAPADDDALFSLAELALATSGAAA